MPTSWSPAPPDSDRRDRVIVVGPDAASYLQSQVAQDLAPLTVGSDTWTLILTPTGRVVSLARVTRVDDDRFVLDTDAGHGAALAERLGQFKIRVDAEITLDPSSADVPGDDADLDDERQRIETRWPRMGCEIISGETLPAGLGLNDVAVSFTKGCYPGQELVERMDSRGAEAPQSLQVVEVGDGIHPGDPVLDGNGDEIGVVTSVAGPKALAWIKRSAS